MLNYKHLKRKIVDNQNVDVRDLWPSSFLGQVCSNPEKSQNASLFLHFALLSTEIKAFRKCCPVWIKPVFCCGVDLENGEIRGCCNM